MQLVETTKSRKFLQIVGIALSTMFVSVAQPMKANTTVSLADPRPLSKAAELFEQKYGIMIAYEDAAYAYQGDLVDKTTQEFLNAHPNSRFLIPKGGSLSIALPNAKVTTDLVPTVQGAIDSYLAAGYGGEFKLLQAGGGLIIVPTGVRNSTGVLVPDSSPLD